MTPEYHWTTLVIDVHQLLSSAMHSNSDSDWFVHSLVLSFHDLGSLPLQRPMFPEVLVFSNVLYRVGQLAEPNHSTLIELSSSAVHHGKT